MYLNKSSYGFGGANLFSSPASMALIIDNETLIIPLNALIKSLLSPLKTWENVSVTG